MNGFNVDDFRKLTQEVINSEKYGFWSDWTQEEQELYLKGDWEAFSKSRGYSQWEIKQFRLWLDMIVIANQEGINALEIVKDLTEQAALNNIALDKKNEIAKSSHIPKEIFRNGITAMEEKMRQHPEAMIGDCYPLKHSFGNGCYVREISVPAGHLVVTKIHKVDHPCFIMKGVCSVLTEDGVKSVEAGQYFITKAGTKRVVYVHSDTVWVTVHVTNETDLEKIEDEIIAKDFSDFALIDRSDDGIHMA